MKEFKTRYISTNTGELQDNVFNVIKATINTFIHYHFIEKWQRIENN